MAYTTTFTCDLCKAQAVNDQSFLKAVRVQVSTVYGVNPFQASNVPVAFWCDPCLVKMGVIHVGNTNLPADKAPATPPTLEEVVRAIVQEEIEAAR
jgi:hypothetical protein